MKTIEKIDCVCLKDEIQDRLRKKWKDDTPQGVRKKVRKRLKQSNTELSRWWRAIPDDR
ncbi:MAG: hypothetical protein QF473_39960 [Planctomycetota bacterium]|jgi:hypothetical protein|nr:hypothetical protein [Planctomycetota bacterium]MDP6505312.1 hypothetical protein [Planctomycetota bacterium]